MIELNFDLSRVEEMLRVLRDNLSERKLELAIKSTCKRMAGWMRARAVPDLSRVLKIQQKQIRRRIKATFQNKGDGVWFGLNPVEAKWLKPKQVRGGVKAEGGRVYSGAFIRKGKVYRRKGKSRFPVEVVSEEIEEKAQDYIESSIDTTAFENQFYVILERELRWRASQ